MTCAAGVDRRRWSVDDAEFCGTGRFRERWEANGFPPRKSPTPVGRRGWTPFKRHQILREGWDLAALNPRSGSAGARKTANGGVLLVSDTPHAPPPPPNAAGGRGLGPPSSPRLPGAFPPPNSPYRKPRHTLERRTKMPAGSQRGSLPMVRDGPSAVDSAGPARAPSFRRKSRPPSRV